MGQRNPMMKLGNSDMAVMCCDEAVVHCDYH